MSINPIFLHIWGPLSIHAYGVFIALGTCIFAMLLFNDEKIKKIISTDELATFIQLFILSGYFGGRIWSMLSEPEPIDDYLLLLKFWEPGLSVLGGILLIVITLSTYAYIKKIPILQLGDRICLYAPITQAFGRIGCFFAGCCYGKALKSWWAVTYTHPYHMAPLNQSLHPTQLYSSFLLFSIFLYLFFIAQKKFKKDGMIFCIYILCVNLERIVIDFIRDDRTFTSKTGVSSLISINQWLAIFVSIGAILCMICITKWTKKTDGSI